jgi:5-methylcytosine-specific restriction endonuclease McrA
MNILNSHIVLVINRNYQILGVTTPQKCFVTMCSSSNGENLASKAVIIDYDRDEKGNYIFDSPTNIKPVFFDEWIKQEIRPFDNFISTTKQKIRIPTVLQAHNCTKIGYRELKPNNRNLIMRYGNRCAYTNQILTNKTFSKDHIIPKSRWKEMGKHGSPDIWENVVPCHKDVNSAKGNRLNSEAGLQLLVKPSAPRPIPMSELIKDIRSRDWELFLYK